LLGFGLASLFFPDLSVLELALFATMLAPTDAALGKPVVSKPTVPSATRKSLNVESGLNDGICVPVVVILLGLAVGRQIEGEAWSHVMSLSLGCNSSADVQRRLASSCARPDVPYQASRSSS
jgi:NhaP-type Na+/H+ or K+/H+ antiporter